MSKKKQIKDLKKTTFKVPKSYFEDFEDVLLSELKLRELSSKSGFETPKNYFENLEDSILNAVSKKEPSRVIPLFSFKKITYTTAIAATLALMFSVFFNPKKTMTIDSLETDTLENYVLNQDLETSDIASLLSNVNLDDFDALDMNLNTNTLEDYVLENLNVDDLISN